MENIPRTVQELIDATHTLELDGVQATAEFVHDRSVEFRFPARFRNTETQEVGTKLLNVGRIGWYVRDGKNHIGGSLSDVRRAIANVQEGKYPLKARREKTGNYTGRDRSGRFTNRR